MVCAIRAYLLRSSIYRELNEFELALADCRQGLDIDLQKDAPSFTRQAAYELRGDIYAEDLQQYDKAIAEYDKALELEPENKACANKRATAVQAIDPGPPVSTSSKVTL